MAPLAMLRRCVLAAAAMVAVTAAGAAHATITNVSTSPSTETVTATDGTSLSITWRVTRIGANATVTSNSGQFIGPDGTVLSTVNVPLTRANVPAGTTTFSETVIVPRSLAVRVVQRGGGVINYVRGFSDGQVVTGALRISLTGSGGGAFRIQRISLRFDDGSTFRRAPEQASLTAFADIRFSGAGQLEARWEIAGPSSTLGTAMFRPIRIVRRYLAGTRTLTLESPELPTGVTGGYRVRLRVTAPETGFEPPELRYYVVGQPPAQARLDAIDLAAPAPGAVVGVGTRFAWSGVQNAAYYELEFHRRGSEGASDPRSPVFVPDSAEGRPTAGVVVSASRTELNVSSTTLAKLARGEYAWRVRAVAANGRMLAASEPRPVRTR